MHETTEPAGLDDLIRENGTGAFLKGLVQREFDALVIIANQFNKSGAKSVGHQITARIFLDLVCRCWTAETGARPDPERLSDLCERLTKLITMEDGRRRGTMGIPKPTWLDMTRQEPPAGA